MIEQVVRRYLKELRRERDFDTPFGLLLSSMGFNDVHLTHGTIEFGKDFIAKKEIDGTLYQCSFQVKRGDLNLGDWRNDVQHQMIQSILTTLRHPNFDRSLPHKPYLIITGEYSSQAAMAIDELNTTFFAEMGKPPILTWSQDKLVSSLVEFGLESLLDATAEDFAEYGDFLRIYSSGLRAVVKIDDIEVYSRYWTNKIQEFEKWALWSALECEILSQRFSASGQLYEALFVHLCRLRSICALIYSRPDVVVENLWQDSIRRVTELAAIYCNAFVELWKPAESIMASTIKPADFVSYPVQCARVLEVCALLIEFSEDPVTIEKALDFLESFVSAEPGCAHPISDRFAVSLVTGGLALLQGGRVNAFRKLLTSAIIWVSDRYEHASGLASVDSSEEEEINMLLGSIFDFSGVSDRRSSFCCTALLDLAAFANELELYRLALNDFEACRIVPEYYLAKDTEGCTQLESDEVLHFPSVQFREDVDEWTAMDHADHLVEESRTFQFDTKLGNGAWIALSIILRDRYFPSLWKISSLG